MNGRTCEARPFPLLEIMKMNESNRRWAECSMSVLADEICAGRAVGGIGLDAAGDNAWFASHPFATERRRAPTHQEIEEFGLAQNDVVTITMLAPGVLGRQLPPGSLARHKMKGSSHGAR
jgi:hypothetical protein